MSNITVRVVGALTDLDGMPVEIGVDFDSVTIRAPGEPIRLTSAQAELFARLFVAACWEAAGQRALMAEEDRA